MVTVGLLELVLPGSLVEVQVGLADVVLVGLVPLVPMVVLVLLGPGMSPPHDVNVLYHQGCGKIDSLKTLG